MIVYQKLLDVVKAFERYKKTMCVASVLAQAVYIFKSKLRTNSSMASRVQVNTVSIIT